MQEDVVYNQIITFARGEVDARTVARSYVEEGKLILVFEDAQKLLIEGRHVDSTGHRERIQEILATAQEVGVVLDAKPVTHYATSRNDDDPVEYVLIRW